MRAVWWSRNHFVDAVLKARLAWGVVAAPAALFLWGAGPRCAAGFFRPNGRGLQLQGCRSLQRQRDAVAPAPCCRNPLQVVLEEGAGRRVIFSTFDPDCAALLSLKQPRFPVFFLTCGGTKLFQVRGRWWEGAAMMACSVGFAVLGWLQIPIVVQIDQSPVHIGLAASRRLRAANLLHSPGSPSPPQPLQDPRMNSLDAALQFALASQLQVGFALIAAGQGQRRCLLPICCCGGHGI